MAYPWKEGGHGVRDPNLTLKESFAILLLFKEGTVCSCLMPGGTKKSERLEVKKRQRESDGAGSP